MSLRSKIISGTLLFVAVVLILLVQFIITSEQQLLKEQVKTQGQSLAEVAAVFVGEPLLSLDYPVLETYAEQLAQSKNNIAFVKVKDRNGLVVAQFPAAQTTLSPADLEVFKAKIWVDLNDREQVGLVEIGMITLQFDQLIISRLQILGLASVAAFVLLAFTLFLLINKILVKPISKLGQQARRLRDGDLKSNITLSGGGELGHLARSLDDVRDCFERSYTKINHRNEQLKDSNNKKQEFLTDITQEMRSSAHAILNFSAFGKRSLEASKNINMSASEKDILLRYFIKIGVNSKQLIGGVDKLLESPELKAQECVLDLQLHDLEKIVQLAVVKLNGFAEEKSLRLEIVPPANKIEARCDQTKLLLVINTLLSNIIKYSLKNRGITISFSPVTLMSSENCKIEAIKVSVMGDDIDMPDGELDTVFDELLSLQAARMNVDNSTLGLITCMDIIKAHNGDVEITNSSDSGVIISFSLPV